MDFSLIFCVGIKDVIFIVFGYIGVGLVMGIVVNMSYLLVWVVLFMLLIVYVGFV